jgi:hypothetical protein
VDSSFCRDFARVGERRVLEGGSMPSAQEGSDEFDRAHSFVDSHRYPNNRVSLANLARIPEEFLKFASF